MLHLSILLEQTGKRGTCGLHTDGTYGTRLANKTFQFAEEKTELTIAIALAIKENCKADYIAIITNTGYWLV